MQSLSEYPSHLSEYFKAKFQSISPWLSDDLMVALLVETCSEAIASYNEERAYQLLIENLPRETDQRLNKIFPNRLDFCEALGFTKETFAEQSQHFNAKELGLVLPETDIYHRAQQEFQSLLPTLSFKQLIKVLQALLKENTDHYGPDEACRLLIENLPDTLEKKLTKKISCTQDFCKALEIDYNILLTTMKSFNPKNRFAFSLQTTNKYHLTEQALKSLPSNLLFEELMEELRAIFNQRVESQTRKKTMSLLIKHLPTVHIKTLTDMFPYIKNLSHSLGVNYFMLSKKINNSHAQQRGFIFSPKKTKAYRLMLQTLKSLPIELSAKDLIKPLQDILMFAKDNYSETEAHRILIKRLPDALEHKLTQHFLSLRDFCEAFDFIDIYFKQSLKKLKAGQKFDFSKNEKKHRLSPKGADQKNTPPMFPMHLSQETKHTSRHEKQESPSRKRSDVFFEKESTLEQEETIFKASCTKKLKQEGENIMFVYEYQQPLNPDLFDEQPKLFDPIPSFNTAHKPFSEINLSFPRSPYLETDIQQPSQSPIAFFNSPSDFFKAPTSDQTFHDEDDYIIDNQPSYSKIR